MITIEEVQQNLKRIAFISFAQFVNDLLYALGIPYITIRRILSKGISDGYRKPLYLYKRAVIIDKSVSNVTKNSLRDFPSINYIIGIDSNEIVLINRESTEERIIKISELSPNAVHFLPLVTGTKEDHIETQDIASIVQILYNELLQYEQNDKSSAINYIFALLGLSFGNYVLSGNLQDFCPEELTKSIGNPTKWMQDIFASYQEKRKSLNEKSLITWSIDLFDLVKFPFISTKSLQYSFHILNSSWQQIDTEAVGAIIYKFVSYNDTNVALYGHFTAIENIDKILLPLFVQQNKKQLNQIKSKSINIRMDLQNFKNMICAYKFFDPTDGPGCFISRCLHFIKELIYEINASSNSTSNLNDINISNFKALVSNEIAEKLTKLLIWMKYWEGNENEAKPELLENSYSSICVFQGDALTENWKNICPNGGNTFLIGTPTFCGRKNLPMTLKNKMYRIFGTPQIGSVDFSATWLLLASRYISNTTSEAAFTLTNSVCQGEQVKTTWTKIFRDNNQIKFAYRSFKWKNNSDERTGVSVVIIGLNSKIKRTTCQLFTEFHTYVEAELISPYLIANDNTIVTRRTTPLSAQLPHMPKGNMPYDHGHLLLTNDEKCEVVLCSPEVTRYLRRIVGSEEFINSIERWCIWLHQNDLAEACKIPFLSDRIKQVRDFRLSCNDVGARRLAKTPYRFREVRETSTQTLVIPSVSSENRKYIPIGFIGPDTIVSNLAFALYDCDLWLFGVITSHMHILWIRTVCGALETRLRYSSVLGYNTFPMPEFTPDQKEQIAELSANIIAIRENYPDRTLGQLYNNLPVDLQHAHILLDNFIESCYQPSGFRNDYEKIQFLFKMYRELNNN